MNDSSPGPQDSSPAAPRARSLLAVGVGSAGLGLAIGLLGGPLSHPGGRAAWVLFLGALALSLLGPGLAARPAAPPGAIAARLSRAGLGSAAAALGLLLGGLLAGAPADALPGGALYLALFGLALGGLTAALGRAGQVLGSGLGLLGCSLPWWAGAAFGGWSDDAQVRAVLWSPLPALAGSFAGLDPLRQGGLYQAFPAAHSVPFAYLSPAGALIAPLLLVAGAAVLLLLRRALARATGGVPRGALAAVVLLLLLARPEPARAQAIFEPTPAPDSQIGDLETRVLLGYWLPRLSGKLKLEGKFQPGNDFSFRRHMDLEDLLVLPTFEVGLMWRNGGRVAIQYMEAFWNGETQLDNTRSFKDIDLPINSVIDSTYKYRSIALQAELHIPIYDFAVLRIIQTTRYIKHETKIRSFDRLNVISVHNTLEAIVPEIGVGADVSIWGPIHVYGDIQWLDFRTSINGAQENRFKFHHREYKLGVRLELVDQAHVLVEWFSLEHSVKDGKRNSAEYYEQNLNGIRVQVAVLF